MQYVRWYDKDPDLSKLMQFIERLNDEIREEVSRDLIQIIMNELPANSDEELAFLSKFDLTDYKRWYDKDISLHSAIEIIKNLNEDLRREIISSFMESIVQILTEYNYDSTIE